MTKIKRNTSGLVPFKKGKDPRRDNCGRKKGKTITSILKDFLDNNAPKEISASKFVELFCKQKGIEITNKEALVAKLLYLSLVKSDLRAITEIIDRTEGKALQSIDEKIDMNVTRTRIKWGKKIIEV